MMFVYQYYKITLIVVVCCLAAFAFYHRYFGNNVQSIVVTNKPKYENLYPISAKIFAKLSAATHDAIQIEKIVETVEIILYDVTRPPPDETKQIECILMKNANPSYNVCLGAADGTAQSLKQGYSWESDIQGYIKQFYNEHPDAMFLDLGMHIGLHSLYVSVVNKNAHVLAVEPFTESILITHKAIHLNNVQNRFKIVVGAVSNKRGPSTAFGTFSGLMVNTEQKNPENATSQVNSVTINDLTPLLKVKKVLLKMDIEASECHVFKNADKFFAEIDVPGIIMEIGRTRSEGACCFEGMLEFLSKRNYQGFYFNSNEPLNFTNWRQWNFGVNIYFKKFY